MTQALRSVAPVASSDNEKADYDQLDDSVVSTCSQGGSAVQDSFMGGEEWTSTILEDLIRMERSGRLQPAGEYSKRRRSNVAVIIVRICFYWFIPLLLSSFESQLSNKPKQDY